MRLHDTMTGRRRTLRGGRSMLSALLVLGALFVNSCANVDPIEPGPALPGRADFSRVVVLGTSFSAGIRSNGLVESGQRSSIATLFARQAQAPGFEIPTVAEPGVPKPMAIVSLVPPNIAAPADDPGQFQSRFINLALPRPYNNLAVPGARVAQVLTTDFFSGNPALDAFYLYAPFILRPPGAGQPGTPMISQALALNPTFAVVELGINDVGGGIFRGQPGLMTTFDSFLDDYRAILDALDNSHDATRISGVALVNVPSPTSYPFMTTVPWFVVTAAGVPVRDPQNNLVPLIGMVGGQARPLPPGSLVTLQALSLIRQGFGLPPGIPGANGQPLPDAVVLDNAPNGELTQANNLINLLNGTIEGFARLRGYAFVDVQRLLQDAAAHGRLVAGVDFSSEYVTGGFFSLDGIHPSAVGQAIAANALIEAVNDRYGSRIPAVNLNEFLGVTFGSGGVAPADQMKWGDLIGSDQFDPAAAATTLTFFPPSSN